MHKRLVPNLLRGRAIDLGKVTFFDFFAYFFGNFRFPQKLPVQIWD